MLVIAVDADRQLWRILVKEGARGEMKRVTVRSDKHETEARIWVPEELKSTRDALMYLAAEGQKEKETLGHFGKFHKRFLEAKRKLCRDKECDCGVKDEEC